jgi:hypothetical protein
MQKSTPTAVCHLVSVSIFKVSNLKHHIASKHPGYCDNVSSFEKAMKAVEFLKETTLYQSTKCGKKGLQQVFWLYIPVM